MFFLYKVEFIVGIIIKYIVSFFFHMSFSNYVFIYCIVINLDWTCNKKCNTSHINLFMVCFKIVLNFKEITKINLNIFDSCNLISIF